MTFGLLENERTRVVSAIRENGATGTGSTAPIDRRSGAAREDLPTAYTLPLAARRPYDRARPPHAVQGTRMGATTGPAGPPDGTDAAGPSVLVVDSEQALAQALADSLAQECGVGCGRSAADPGAAADVLASGPPDVLVVATDCAEWDALAFVRELRRRFPGLPVVAMSGDDDPAHVTAAVRAGAVSWVPKQVSVRELATVVVGVTRGEASLPPVVLLQVLRRLTADHHDGAALARLTMRERQILEHTAHGLSRREIADRLHVSVNTVRTHSQHMLSKLGVHTTLEAVTLVLRESDTEQPDA
jgi:DNA-binding NarL/FixJ family response regulator